MKQEKITLTEMTNAVQACEVMKERVSSINAVLMGKDLWDGISKSIESIKEPGNMSLVGLGVVTTENMTTSHCLYFGSIKDAIEMKKALEATMGKGGLTWEQVMELLKDGKKWDEEKIKWQAKEKT